MLIYIQNGEISENTPEKVLREKKPDDSFFDSLNYNNSPPTDADVNGVAYDNKNTF